MRLLLFLLVMIVSCSSIDERAEDSIANNDLSSDYETQALEYLEDAQEDPSWDMEEDEESSTRAVARFGFPSPKKLWKRNHTKPATKTAKNNRKDSGRKSARTLSRKNYRGACYYGLGCFDYDFYDLHMLPNPKLTVLSFFLIFTRNERSGLKFTYLRVEEAAKLITKPTWLIIIVHGFTASSKAKWSHQLKDKSLENIDCTVIIVDWGKGSTGVAYKQAVTNSQMIGRQVARIVFQLMKLTEGKVAPERTHWMGHSLGGQMTCYFWAYFSELTDGKIIAKITALDPAASFYEHNDFYLNTSMAEFVEVIHTSSGSGHGTAYGMSIPAGHVDFYMNGGDAPQPGCLAVMGAVCSHSRAQLFYIEAIDINSPCTMFSYACTGGRAQYDANECDEENENWSAITFNNTQNLPGRGVQFIDTNPHSPFCIPLGDSDNKHLRKDEDDDDDYR